MRVVGRVMLSIAVLAFLAGCGQTTSDTSPPPTDTDVTPYLESIYNFDDAFFDDARRVVSPGSPAARYLLHAERARLAYVAADRLADLDSPRIEIAAIDGGYEACFPVGNERDCQVMTDLEFDEDGLLVHYAIDGAAWTDNVITFSEGASWIESDAAMIELTSVSIGTLGTLRLTLRYVSLDDDLMPDASAPLTYRPSGLGPPMVLPDCDRTEASAADCIAVDYVFGAAEGSAGARTEVVMFVVIEQPDSLSFSLDDHLGIPLAGLQGEATAWISLRTGRGVIETDANR